MSIETERFSKMKQKVQELLSSESILTAEVEGMLQYLYEIDSDSDDKQRQQLNIFAGQLRKKQTDLLLLKTTANLNDEEKDNLLLLSEAANLAVEVLSIPNPSFEILSNTKNVLKKALQTASNDWKKRLDGVLGQIDDCIDIFCLKEKQAIQALLILDMPAPSFLQLLESENILIALESTGTQAQSEKARLILNKVQDAAPYQFQIMLEQMRALLSPSNTLSASGLLSAYSDLQKVISLVRKDEIKRDLSDLSERMKERLEEVRRRDGRDSLIQKADNILSCEVNEVNIESLRGVQYEIERFIEQSGDSNEHLLESKKRVQNVLAAIQQSDEKYSMAMERIRDYLQAPRVFQYDDIVSLTQEVKLTASVATHSQRKEIENLLDTANNKHRLLLEQKMLEKAQKAFSRGDFEQVKRIFKEFNSLFHEYTGTILTDVDFLTDLITSWINVNKSRSDEISGFLSKHAITMAKFPSNARVMEIHKQLSETGKNAYETGRNLFANIEFLPDLSLQSRMEMAEEAQRQIDIADKTGQVNMSLILPLRRQIENHISILEEARRKEIEIADKLSARPY